MIDETKELLDELRTERCRLCIHMKIGRCAHIQQGKTCGTLYHQAADLIESLAAELEQVKQERDGLNIMLGQAQSMLETRTRERDAAIEDMQKSALYLCQVCKKYHPAVKGVHAHFCEQLGQRTDFNGAIACGMFEWRGVQEADNAEND